MYAFGLVILSGGILSRKFGPGGFVQGDYVMIPLKVHINVKNLGGAR